MKKLTLSILLACACLCAKAQGIYAEFTAGMGYANDNFSACTLIGGGYEFNDKWAAGANMEFDVVSDHMTLMLEAYGRYTFWRNELVCLDGKAKLGGFLDDCDGGVVGRLVPAVRVKLNEKWQLGADVGMLGVIVAGDGEPFIQFAPTNALMSLIYRF